jgi:pyridoxal phosphate enzyme (YggS family)
VTDTEIRALLQQRLDAVEARIAAACARSGRERDAVTLVAVTKTVAASVAAMLPELGVCDLGENRPQELWRKAALVSGVRWHLVGHLQRNKIERTLPLCRLLHSVDSVRLLDALEAASQSVEILLEVNVSGEESKMGFAPDAVLGLAPRLAELRTVRVRGLMTMAPFEADAERCRPVFVGLRELRERLQAAVGATPALPELSMGMTNDYEVAVEEGATLIRIGTALFEGLPGPERERGAG